MRVLLGESHTLTQEYEMAHELAMTNNRTAMMKVREGDSLARSGNAEVV